MMGRRSTVRWFSWALAVSMAAGLPSQAQDDAPASNVPAPLAPFAYLVGGWKGTGAPTANRVRGWLESHAWAWAFEKGRPVGLTAQLTGNKVLATLRLTHDPASNRYTLRGTDPSGKPVAFAGALDKGGKSLVLDRDGLTPEGAKQRLTLVPNGNAVRYTLSVAEQSRGAPRFAKTVEVGVTKEGESFAAGSDAADLPKCVVTGGAAALTVSYQGKSYPLCCTGCRDEFNENPAKYVKKAMLLGSAPAVPAAKPDGPPPSPSTPKAKSESAPAKGQAADPAARAATLLRIGQNLEKSGKSAAALGYYRQVVKDFPGTPSAETAAGRVKALGGR